ncbi:MAG: hypothetical protein MUC32_04245 [Burkholderiaceae bacterium]|nr:hypothetical protein [Burkholderiaceae bacterium]MCU0929907.1 hypothetical protein [Burkholderiaceae bacterium]
MKLGRWTARAAGVVVLTAAAGVVVAQEDSWPPERIKSEWVGKKVFSRAANGQLADFWLKEDGSAEVALSSGFSDTGQWRLSDTGYCAKWQKIRGGEERCFTVRNRMGQVQVFNPDGSVNATIIRVQ